jgi:hypothetical protein
MNIAVGIPVKSRQYLFFIFVCFCVAGGSATATARGVSPYLPLKIAPEVERQIERVLLLANVPVMTRPIAAATVLDALPKARERDPVLCAQVERYLQRYMGTATVTHLRTEVAIVSGSSQATIPESHGESVDSAWNISGVALYQPADHLLLSAGVVAHDGSTKPTGTAISAGFDVAQLDVGYRDHWFSPLTDSSYLMGAQAPTMPSITLSNYAPLGFLRFQYEVFLAQMSKSDRISYQQKLTSGYPRLAGLHLQIEPAEGYSLAVNRLMQFGGGLRGGNGFKDFLHALYKPQRYDNTNANLTTDQEFGNQQASLTSRLVFSGRVPFATYVEYAGEDNSYGQNFRLGNTALSFGIDFPLLWRQFDLTYEMSEWQNAWYVHHIYGDGVTNDGHVIGHWFGDERAVGNDVGGMSNMLRVGWWLKSGGYVQARYRTLQNKNYFGIQYRRMHELGLSYSRNYSGYLVGAELLAGRDVFGESYMRLSGSLDLNGDWWSGISSIATETERDDSLDLFVDLGMHNTQHIYYLGDVPQFLDSGAPNPDAWKIAGISRGLHVGVGARRAISEHSDLGVRLEADRVSGHNLFALRALDYRYRFAKHLALNGFVGIGRYDLATPAYGYYMGLGVQWRNIWPRWDLSLDGRHFEKLARDKVLPSDPAPQPRNDEFHDIDGVAMYLSYRLH